MNLNWADVHVELKTVLCRSMEMPAYELELGLCRRRAEDGLVQVDGDASA